MIEIRIYGLTDKQKILLHKYMSTTVPRIGEKICIQYWAETIIDVEWSIINENQCKADIFVEIKEKHRSILIGAPY